MPALSKFLVLLALFLLARHVHAFTSLSSVAGDQVRVNHLIRSQQLMSKPTNETKAECKSHEPETDLKAESESREPENDPKAESKSREPGVDSFQSKQELVDFLSSNAFSFVNLDLVSVLGACWGTEELGWSERSRKQLRDVRQQSNGFENYEL